MSGNTVFHTLLRMNVVKQIVIGLLLGIALYIVSPQAAMAVQILGKMFVGALQAVAPFLVFVLVTAAITKHQKGNETQIKPILRPSWPWRRAWPSPPRSRWAARKKASTRRRASSKSCTP